MHWKLFVIFRGLRLVPDPTSGSASGPQNSPSPPLPLQARAPALAMGAVCFVDLNSHKLAEGRKVWLTVAATLATAEPERVGQTPGWNHWPLHAQQA